MATPPTVQTLAQAMTELDPAYAASRDLVTKQQAALPAKYDAQRAGINAERGQGFNAINNQATGRGGSFSGIPVDEQATYLATKYLPAQMTADVNQNAEDLSLQGNAADIAKEQRLAATGRVDKQTSDLNSWNTMQAQNEFSASEAAKSRAFTASQNVQEKLSPYESAMAIISNAAVQGDVTSSAFQVARDAYRSAGGDTGQFATDFWKYVPQSANEDGSWKNYYYG